MKSNILKVILAVAIVLLTWLIYQNLEQYSEEVDYGWSRDAQRNPYLALHQFLENRGSTIESVTHFRQGMLTDEQTTLLIPDANYIRLPSQQREIMAWVRAGGHLIVGLGEATEPAMLSELGFSQSWSYWDDDEDESSINDEEDEEKSLADRLREQNEAILKSRKDLLADDNEGEDKAPVCKSFTYPCRAYEEPTGEDDVFIVKLSFEGVEDAVHINFPWKNFIKHEAFFSEPEDQDLLPNPLGIKPFYWEGDDEGIHFAQTYYEAGMISILSDFDIWQSDSIGHFDHAFFLSILVTRDDKALLLYGKYMPSLDVLIYRHFFETLLSFSIVLVLALLYYSRRFGPIYSLSQHARRSRGEQFTALSQFRWKQQDGKNLLEHIRTDIRRLAVRHWHNFADWSASQQHQQLADMSDLPVTTVEKIMQGEIRFNENEFTQVIRALQILRNSL